MKNRSGKIKNIIANIILYTLIILNFSTYCLASSGEIELTGPVEDTLTKIIAVLLIIAAGVCVGKCIHIGILYTTSSAIEKSNAKQALMPWIVGAIICFGASWIGPFIINLLKVDNKKVLEY